jgi:acyl carrier protein
MTEPEIYDALNQVFRQVLEDATIVLTAEDVEGWDSMNHIFIVAELEKRLGLKFKAAEMEELKNAGELMSLLRQKLDKKR